MNVNSATKYDRLACGFSEKEYADPRHYNLRKATIAVNCGHRQLQPGDTVLELGCGDGITSYYFAQTYGMRVIGVDQSEEMVKAARKRCQECTPRPVFLTGNLNDLGGLELPDEPVQCVTLFRASYYVRDWSAFALGIRQRTPKVVMDVDPRKQDLQAVLCTLREAEFRQFWNRPFFTPMTRSLPRLGYKALEKAEDIPLVSHFILRYKFPVMVIAET